MKEFHYKGITFVPRAVQALPNQAMPHAIPIAPSKLAEVLNLGAAFPYAVEKILLEAIGNYFPDVEDSIPEVIMVGRETFVFTTPKGSFFTLTDKGGMYAMHVREYHPSDLFLINRVLTHMPKTYGIVEAGSPAFRIYERFECDFIDIGASPYFEVERLNYVGKPIWTMQEIADKVGVHLWRVTSLVQ